MAPGSYRSFLLRTLEIKEWKVVIMFCFLLHGLETIIKKIFKSIVISNRTSSIKKKSHLFNESLNLKLLKKYFRLSNYTAIFNKKIAEGSGYSLENFKEQYLFIITFLFRKT